MRVVVGVMAVVVLAVAVVGAEFRLKGAKRFQLCTARDISMLTVELCSGRIGHRVRNGYHHRAAPANTGIMTLRVPSRQARGGRNREDDDPPYGQLPLWDNLNNPRFSAEELVTMDGAADLLSTPEWEIQDSNSYEDPSAESGSLYEAPRSLGWWYGWRGEENPDYLSSSVMRLNTDNNGAKSRLHTLRSKRQRTFNDLRVRCCREGCEASELYSLCL